MRWRRIRARVLITGAGGRTGATGNHAVRQLLARQLPVRAFVVVWHVLDNYFKFVQDQTEWKRTDVVFEMTKKGGKTEGRFTHVGLVPAFECYDVCSNAWGGHVGGSLESLFATGKGEPNTKER